MLIKRVRLDDVYGIVPQHLSDMVKARLPESQCPAEESHSRREHVYIPAPSEALDDLSVGGTSCPRGDEKRSHSRT